MKGEKTMFCTKCGKKIEYDALVCNECVKAEESFFDATQDFKAQDTEPVNMNSQENMQNPYQQNRQKNLLNYLSILESHQTLEGNQK